VPDPYRTLLNIFFSPQKYEIACYA